ncbi:tpr domain protein [Moniliophthora roreri]|nr:tpr domain protein [Moniliophthora roreri]
MPRKRRLIPIRRSYSRDLKWWVIYQATLYKTSTQIAIDLDMPVWVIQRVKKTFRHRRCQSRGGMGRASLLTPEQTQLMVGYIQWLPAG